ADKIVTLFSKQHGKLITIAKGVRKIRSRRGGNIDLLNYVTLSLVHGQSMQIITEAQVISSFGELKSNLATAVIGYYIVELVNIFTVEDQVHPDIFRMLKDVLEALAKKPKRLYIQAFEIKLLKSLGFWDSRELVKEPALLALATKIEV